MCLPLYLDRGPPARFRAVVLPWTLLAGLTGPRRERSGITPMVLESPPPPEGVPVVMSMFRVPPANLAVVVLVSAEVWSGQGGGALEVEPCVLEPPNPAVLNLCRPHRSRTISPFQIFITSFLTPLSSVIFDLI